MFGRFPAPRAACFSPAFQASAHISRVIARSALWSGLPCCCDTAARVE